VRDGGKNAAYLRDLAAKRRIALLLPADTFSMPNELEESRREHWLTPRGRSDQTSRFRRCLATQREREVCRGVLAVENIHKSFGENEVLKGISLAAKKYGVFSILGSSGSGRRARTEGEQLFGTAAQASLFGWHAAMYGEECVVDASLSSP
jgi:hypothetical protein